MQYVAAVFAKLFIVETDAFIMVCHVFENLYPAVLSIQDFFFTKNRFIGLHQELRIFAIMAEKMRPKLYNSLKAVYSAAETKETDSSPFVNLMKNIAEVWFKTLFTTVFNQKAVLRIFDTFLVFGVEFLHKFGLSFLSKKEKFIINSIKTETKDLKLGFSVDALIIAGNVTKFKVLQNFESFDVEPLIKKCLKKPTYKVLKRFDYLSIAVVSESKSSERISRLKKSKSLLISSPLSLENALAIINSIKTETVYRSEFNEITSKIAL